MKGIAGILQHDLVDLLKMAGGALLLFAVLVDCLAVGALIAFAVLGDIPGGLAAFDGTLGLSGFPLIEAVRKPLELLNRGVLIGFPVWMIFVPLKRYLSGLKTRARYVDLTPTNSDDHQKQAANS
ncbi:MAG: hypothetical protein K1X83_00350 [Oligoflexia bacterium]|nr:hypothetical protein [Oligoflexia bacterium]